MDDQAIIALYWSRDQRALEESQRKYGPLCFRLSESILASREDAEECVSDGLLSDEPMQMYASGFLSDLDFASVDRVFYLEAEIIIPAGESVALTVEMVKAGSCDHYCTHTENQGVYGYDMVTELGSNLTCTRQSAGLEDRGQIEIVRENFGFDLKNGVKTVELDPAAEHYYLEVILILLKILQ